MLTLKKVIPACLAASALLLLLALGGCDSKSKMDDSPSSTSGITVTASPAAVTVNGTVVVEATLTQNGSPVSGETVTFSVQPSTAGYFSPEAAATDADGSAAAVFTATSTGSAMISATASGFSSDVASTSVQVTSTQQSSGAVSVAITPGLLLANGVDTAIVTITVRDALAQPAPDNTLVRITAGEKYVDIDGNGFWSPGIDSLVFDANANGTWDAFGVIPSTATTSGGAVSVPYVSGSDAQTVYVKASVNSNGITGEGEMSLQLSPDATPDFIYLSSDSMQLSVTQTGGIEAAWLRATVYDVNTNPVPEGLPVSFYILDGPGGGERLGLVDQGPYETVTNSQGIASATIHSGSLPGTIRIRAMCGGVLSNATQVLVSAGPPAYIVMGVEECNVPYWQVVASEVGVTAVVSDIYLNPVNDSEVVYFSCDEGTMKSHEERTKEHEGIVESKWFSGTNVPGADGVVWVYAETAGGTVACSTYFYNTWLPTSITVDNAEPSISADGESSFWVTVHGFDINGNYVVGGTAFEAKLAHKLLTVSGGAFENGCWGASADVEVKSKVLSKDWSLTGADDDGIGGVETVTFSHQAGASASFDVVVLTGTAYRGSSSLTIYGSPGGGDIADIVVTIKDRPGNPLGDHTIEIPGGSTIETDENGEAAFQYTVPAAPGTYNISVTDLDPRGNIMLSTTITVE